MWIKSMPNELDITIYVIASQLSRYCDIINNRLWCHQQKEGRASETRGRCVKIVIYGFVMSCKKKNNVCTLMTNYFCNHSSIIFVFISLFPTQKINTKITLSWVLEQFITRIHTLSGLEIPSSPIANAMRNGEGLQLSHISLPGWL